MDNLTVQQRSEVMSRIRSKGTKPELIVRSLVHGMGFRYRLHISDLPGTPDLVFPGRRKVVFVNGCFWHGHYCRAGNNRPASNREFWDAKLDRNMKRDRLNRGRLRRMGWRVLSVWGCQIGKREVLAARLKTFLEEA